jgi:hypothetical protein
MPFRDRLLGSLRAVQPILDLPGVMVGGSQVPNLLEPSAAATLVVSQDVDLIIPVDQHSRAKGTLDTIVGYAPADDEPSVWVPANGELLEVNFIGRDPALHEAAETYVLEDTRLPLLVFGLLTHLRPGPVLIIGDLRVPLPRPAGLLLEKLLTERSGLKGERDLLVALGLLLVSQPADLDEAAEIFSRLDRDQRRAALSNLGILSLMKPLPWMPDPTRARGDVASLIRRLEAID